MKERADSEGPPRGTVGRGSSAGWEWHSVAKSGETRRAAGRAMGTERGGEQSVKGNADEEDRAVNTPAHEIRVAVVGVGNCAASLVQGVRYYADADPATRVPGLMHVDFGGYHVRDVRFVAAFDVDAKKVGRDLSEAIFASENNTIKITDVPPLGVTVQRGPTLDGLGRFYRETITESDEEQVDVVAALRESRADVLVSYLPVGSEQADRFYAQCALDAGVAFVNALPVFIASDPEWAEKFRAAGVPIIGDDIKSQVGATITHRVLAKLFEDRGIQLDRTMQLNVGGNMDFLNMKELERLESKKVSKTQSVTSQLSADIGKENVHIGPSDYVSWLDDRKWAYVRLEGRAFGDVPLNLEYKLEVWDSPNSAGIIIDAIRAAKIALDRGMGGPVLSASSYFMKSPPEQYSDSVARDAVEAFIRGD
jgi:myo-inositol-1-phosphate synthase